MIAMRLFFAVMLAGAAFGQANGSAIGLLPDHGKIRAIYGAPAEGTIGPALDPGQRYTQAVASPTGLFVLASAEGGEIVVVTLAADGAKLTAVTVRGASAGNIELSPRGSAALISDGTRVQVLGGLPGSPEVLRTLDTSALGKASALAVSDDGRWVAGVFGGSVRGLGPAGELTALPAPGGVTALTFFHGTEDLVVTTSSRIVKVSGIGGAATPTSILVGPEDPPPPESPIALALTSDNAYIVVLEPSGGIAQVNVASGAARTATCGCAVQGLFGLGGFAFRVGGLAGGVVKVYDVLTARVVELASAAPDLRWRDKQFSEWTEEDAKEVLTSSPWVKKVTPAVVKTPAPDKRKGSGNARPTDAAPPTPAPMLTLRWESAPAMRQAERTAGEANAPQVDEDHYAIAVYGIPRAMVANDSKDLPAELKKHAALKRDAKMDLRPSRVDLLLREDGPVIVYLFPKSPAITWRDQRVQFEAQVARLKISQSFETGPMTFHGNFEP